MTFLEKEKEICKEKGKTFDEYEITKKCPDEYGLENESECPRVGKDVCKECWNREMPGTEPLTENKRKIDFMSENAYNQGLNDAWELAKKITCTEEKGGMPCDDVYKIFSTDTCWKVFAMYTPQEALAKLKAYEEAKVLIRGDEVICLDTDEKAIFFGKSENSEEGWFLMKEYDVPQRIMLNTVKKTGKHIDCLEQIGE